RNARRDAHVLLEPGDDGNRRRPDRIAGEWQTQRQARAVHELRVPSDDPGVERHPQPAAPRYIRPLHGLGSETDPARERGDREQRQGDESGSGSRQGVMAGIAVPNHALIVCTTFFAMRRFAAVVGRTPSDEDADPKGGPAPATDGLGHGASWAGTARTEAGVG